ncbi:MAG: hypothetical protein LBB61_02950 [Treponema sp.]|nr:hypothetical protein [Treponema sp.]
MKRSEPGPVETFTGGGTARDEETARLLLGQCPCGAFFQDVKSGHGYGGKEAHEKGGEGSGI